MGSIEGALLGSICVGVVQSLSGYCLALGFQTAFVLFLLVMISSQRLLGQKGAATIGMNE
jgi:branched-subunit amino acid ABC-type transport system permease component